MTKYQFLKDEMHRDFCVYFVPVVVGALGIVKDGQTDNVKRISDNCSIFEIQKSVLLGSMAI